MREVVLDTETTGLSAKTGDRLVEIGCIELINHLPSGEVYHQYINPEVAMPREAQEVHGLSDEFLSDKPRFLEIVDAFLDFVGVAPLIIHNASFDMGFINSELDRIKREPLPNNQAIDTVLLARRKYPGSPASLDALCRRFEIDNTARTLHGALLDAELLAEVYLELIGGRQPDLVLANAPLVASNPKSTERIERKPRPHQPTAEELIAHTDFIGRIKDPIWKK
jgi:DNA polymerase-3 subunit epsilon